MLLWEARIVVTWIILEEPRMLEYPLLISSLDLFFLHEAVVGEEARRQEEDSTPRVGESVVTYQCAPIAWELWTCEMIYLDSLRVNVTSAWPRYEVLVSSVIPREHLGRLFVTILIIHLS